MLPLVLDALSQSRNQAHRPVLDALGVIARHAARKMRCYPAGEAVPLERPRVQRQLERTVMLGPPGVEIGRQVLVGVAASVGGLDPELLAIGACGRR